MSASLYVQYKLRNVIIEHHKIHVARQPKGGLTEEAPEYSSPGTHTDFRIWTHNTHATLRDQSSLKRVWSASTDTSFLWKVKWHSAKLDPNRGWSKRKFSSCTPSLINTICLFSTAWFTRVNLSFCGVVVASNWAVTIMSPNQRLLVPLTPSMSPVCLLHFWPDLTRSQITSASNLVIMFIIRWTDRLVAFVTQTPTGHFFAWLLLSPDPYFIFIYIYIYIWNYDIYKPRDSY